MTGQPPENRSSQLLRLPGNWAQHLDDRVNASRGSCGQSLLENKRGAALVEFAMVAPVLLMLLLGMFEMGYNYYMAAQLQGAVQKAARDSSTHTAQSSAPAIDARVAKAVHAIVPAAALTFSRKSYASFSDIHRSEDFTDLDDNGICNDGEPFEDANANGIWDDDRGAEGGGGARDAVLYVVDVSYPRAFGVAGFIGLPEKVQTQAVTVLRNQPWDSQKIIAAVANCL